jgi:CBS domain-containing protein
MDIRVDAAQEETMGEEPPGPSTRSLRDAQVADVMSSPLVTCSPSVPLREVAALMTGHRIHAVVVLAGAADPGGEDEEWGVISELDLLGGASLAVPDLPAGRVAATPPVVVGPDESLERAAMLMAEYQITHLIAVEDREAVGIVSALDVARALAPPLTEPAENGGEQAVRESLAGAPGDRLVIRGHNVGQLDRDAEILEVRGSEGGPPFLVRWEDGGRVSLLYPGSDARIEKTGSR